MEIMLCFNKIISKQTFCIMYYEETGIGVVVAMIV